MKTPQQLYEDWEHAHWAAQDVDLSRDAEHWRSMDEATRADMRQWTGCIAGALTRAEFEQALAEAGFEEIEITETHRVHEHAGSAIIRARKP